MDLDIHEDVSGDTPADEAIRGGATHRPISAPPKRFASYEQLVDTIHGITLQTLPPRPESAQPQRLSSSGGTKPHVSFGKEKRDRPVSAPIRSKSTRTATSKTYLREAADKKKAKEREFALELFQDKIDQERKVGVKITQANKLMRRQGSKKTYYMAKNRDDFVIVRVIEDNLPERLLSIEAFHILFPPLALWASKSKDIKPAEDPAHNKTPQVRLQSKKEIQSGLRMILKGTIELTAILQEQLFELQNKGWNSNTVKAALEPEQA
ncbi:hypothetical protein ACHHYP_00312 [Achlya hypogyna]|uniref:Uncharacterized protein n=1 Tax=Achlya hypogyna TaxID=1202772 RepID=A0A1V9ZUK6_ACHHY|nr:hypothetical protein ACHHYP_00312 [Achlya hypogyna]